MSKHSLNVLREAAPYVQSHRGKLFVIALDSQVVGKLGDERADRLIMDIALLHCFDIRVVLVFGIRHQLDEALARQGLPSAFGDHDNWRVTDARQLELMKQVVAERQARLAALLRHSLIYHGVDEGKFDVLTDQRLVYAQPYGVQGGIDYQYTGIVKKIQVDKIRAQTEWGNLALISPLAASAQGQHYNLRAIEVALATAAAAKADKLIVVGADMPTGNGRNFYHAEEFYREMDSLAGGGGRSEEGKLLKRLVGESIEKGVGRVHFIDHTTTDSLLTELFTHEGCGLLISCDPYEQFRPARPADVQRILELYQPARAKGELIERDHDQILGEIGSYHLLLCDQIVIGVAALSPLGGEGTAEIHGLAIDPEHRKQGRGKRLALSLIEKARRCGYKELFALTTKAQDFFADLGMESVAVDSLPAERAKSIPDNRNSMVFRLKL